MNMSQAIKEDLLPKLRTRYQQRNREGKTRMLDELGEDYGYAHITLDLHDYRPADAPTRLAFPPARH